MKRLSIFTAGLLVVAFALVGCSSQPSGSGWVTLIDGGKGLENFNRIGDANWRAEGGAVVADKGKGGHLVTKESYKDYEIYAEGEALLGWLNATVQLTHATGFSADEVLEALAGDIQQRLAPAEIAHLKMTLSPADGLGDIAAINLVRSDLVPELSLSLEAPVTSGQLIVNARAEAAPEALRDAVNAAVAALPARFAGLTAQLEHLEHFRPGKPTPTHRDVA